MEVPGGIYLEMRFFGNPLLASLVVDTASSRGRIGVAFDFPTGSQYPMIEILDS